MKVEVSDVIWPFDIELYFALKLNESRKTNVRTVSGIKIKKKPHNKQIIYKTTLQVINKTWHRITNWIL